MLPMLLLFGAFIFGSILAWRGERSWRTVLMLLGSIAQGVGFLTYFVGMALLMSRVASMASSSRGAAISHGIEVWGTVMLISGLLILGGMLAFAIGFVAYCARAGSAAKRAAELEGMLGHLQQRLAESDAMAISTEGR